MYFRSVGVQRNNLLYIYIYIYIIVRVEVLLILRYYYYKMYPRIFVNNVPQLLLPKDELANSAEIKIA